jgi:dolichyl-phosphate-mannose-protein mannosyltransferase
LVSRQRSRGAPHVRSDEGDGRPRGSLVRALRTTSPLRSLQTLAASPRLPWVLIAVGVVLRVARYLDNRSLWLDESFLALNLINRPFSDLFDVLDYQQAAPPGFLALEKVAVELLGESEYALRLFPLLAGIGSLFLFWEVARRWLARPAAVIGLVLFVFLESLIYYSSETKQYAFDVVATLVLLLAFTLVLDRERWSWTGLALIAGVGAVVMFVSYAAVFVLAGIGVGIAIAAFARSEWSRLRALALLAAVWLTGFALLYVISVRKTGSVQEEIFGSESGQATALGEAKHLARSIYNSFATTAGFHRSLIALLGLALLVGAASLFARRSERFLVLASIIVVALVADVADKYPFSGRFSLFLVPVALLVVAEGLHALWERTRGAASLVGLAVIALVLVPPIALAAVRLVQPPRGEDIKPVLTTIAERWREGDTLYLHYPSQFAFRYYAECEGCDPVSGAREMEDLWPVTPADTSGEDEEPALVSHLPQLVVGRPAGDNLEGYFEDLESLRGKRVWFLFSHALMRQGLNEESFFLVELDRRGQRLDSVDSSGAAAYLYGLR